MHLTCQVDMTDFRNDWQRTVVQVKRDMYEAVDVGTTAAVERAKADAPFKDRSGDLRRNIHHTRPTWSNREVWCWFQSLQDYAGYVEDGTRAHDIWPKEGHGFVGPLRSGQSRRAITDIGTHRIALRWYVNGQPVFARMVHHPGGKPYPYMWPAAYWAEAWIRVFLEDRLSRLQRIWN